VRAKLTTKGLDSLEVLLSCGTRSESTELVMVRGLSRLRTRNVDFDLERLFDFNFQKKLRKRTMIFACDVDRRVSSSRWQWATNKLDRLQRASRPSWARSYLQKRSFWRKTSKTSRTDKDYAKTE